jgi:hypothetical protein
MSSLHVLDGREYYHGTSPSSAVCISEEGFRILDRKVRFWRGALGTGIYITRNPKESLVFGGVQSSNHTYVLQLEFTRGTKIARLDDQANQRLLDSLRREFGREVMGSRFAQAIPKNKRIKPRQLFALIGHLERSDLLSEATTLRHVRRWLQRLGYHGYGHTHNDLGIMLFDPSRVILRDVKRLRRPSKDRFEADLDESALLPVKPIEMLTDAEAELLDMEERIREDEADPDLEYQSGFARTELEHRRKLINQYKKKHGVT